MNRRSWQRLLLSLLGVAVIGVCWYVAIQHLYSLKPEALASFTTITTNAFYVIGAIIIFMVSGRLIYEWKNQTVSHIIEEGTQRFSEHKIERPRDHDDGEIP